MSGLTPRTGEKPVVGVQWRDLPSDKPLVEDSAIRTGPVEGRRGAAGSRSRQNAQSQQWIGCHDPFGRDRAMSVLAVADSVIVVSPPGQTAVLSVQQLRELDRVLDCAATDMRARTPAAQAGDT
jgi:hypothetical protein